MITIIYSRHEMQDVKVHRKGKSWGHVLKKKNNNSKFQERVNVKRFGCIWSGRNSSTLGGSLFHHFCQFPSVFLLFCVLKSRQRLATRSTVIIPLDSYCLSSYFTANSIIYVTCSSSFPLCRDLLCIEPNVQTESDRTCLFIYTPSM